MCTEGGLAESRSKRAELIGAGAYVILAPPSNVIARTTTSEANGCSGWNTLQPASAPAEKNPFNRFFSFWSPNSLQLCTTADTYPPVPLHSTSDMIMKFASVTRTVSVLGALLPSTYAWGGLGHETVAFIASTFVKQGTKDFFQSILNDTSPQYLANVATWADSFRYTKGGRFSEPFHFIDSKDNPPLSCSVVYSRDCGSTGCVVEAIQNYVCIKASIYIPES